MSVHWNVTYALVDAGQHLAQERDITARREAASAWERAHTSKAALSSAGDAMRCTALRIQTRLLKAREVVTLQIRRLTHHLAHMVIAYIEGAGQ